MLSELLGKYQEPAFQRALQEAHASAGHMQLADAGRPWGGLVRRPSGST